MQLGKLSPGRGRPSSGKDARAHSGVERPPCPSKALGEAGAPAAAKLDWKQEALCFPNLHESPGLPLQTQELEFPAALAGCELRVHFEFKKINARVYFYT